MAGMNLKQAGTLVLLVAASLAVFVAQAGALPAGLNHVDPKAPCFRWPAVDYDGDGVYDRLDDCPNTMKGCAVDEHGCPHDADGDGVCDELDQCPGTPAGMKVDPNGCAEGQSVARKPMVKPVEPPKPKSTPPPPAPKPPPSRVERELVERGTVRLENIYFETNSAALLPESQQSLDEAGAALAKYPQLKVEVQGHTDTRGAAAANMRLSEARANSVRAYLLRHFASLRSENLVARGYGETRPETRERNQEELLRNRRVELKVLNPEALPGHVKLQGN